MAIGDFTIDENVYSWQVTDEYTTINNQGGLYSIIDTGSTALMISALYYESLINKIFDAVPDTEWEFDSGIVLTECDVEYPSVYFMFDQKWIEVAPKDYVMQADDTGELCYFFILPVNMPLNVIGMPLFVDYYTIHDPLTGQIGWAPHAASNKDSLTRADSPSTARFLEIGEVMTQSVSQSAQYISWAVAAVFAFVLFDLWMMFLAPSWSETMPDTVFYIVSGLYIACVFLVCGLLVQPLIYMLAVMLLDPQSALEGGHNVSQSASNSLLSYLDSLDLAVLGLISGLILYRYVFKQKLANSLAQKGRLKQETEDETTEETAADEDFDSDVNFALTAAASVALICGYFGW